MIKKIYFGLTIIMIISGLIYLLYEQNNDDQVMIYKSYSTIDNNIDNNINFKSSKNKSHIYNNIDNSNDNSYNINYSVLPKYSTKKQLRVETQYYSSYTYNKSNNLKYNSANNSIFNNYNSTINTKNKISNDNSNSIGTNNNLNSFSNKSNIETEKSTISNDMQAITDYKHWCPYCGANMNADCHAHAKWCPYHCDDENPVPIDFDLSAFIFLMSLSLIYVVIKKYHLFS